MSSDSVTDKLDLIMNSGNYSVTKDENTYSVTDYDNDIEAIYYVSHGNWDYGVIDIRESESDYKSIDVDAFNELVEFTRELSEDI